VAQRTVQTLAFSLLAAVLLLAGCAQKSPEERVAETRAEYTVRLNAFLPQEPEVEEPAAGEGEEMAGEDEEMAEEGEEMAGEGEEAMAADEMEGGDEEMAGEGEEMAAEGPHTAEILFDLIVQFEGDEALPGITVDISHADPFEQEKAVYHHWIETGDMIKGETKQESFVMAIPDFETGDVFSVDLRSYVPPEERGEYREFAEAGP
jgi:hypothetical protein